MVDENPTEHLDPHTVPPWLMQSASKHDPHAMGYLAAGYLAGVQVGRKSGPCMATAEGPSAPLRCALADGHRGGHATAGPVTWSDPTEPAVEASTPGEEAI